jgi:hypothetical protein
LCSSATQSRLFTSVVVMLIFSFEIGLLSCIESVLVDVAVR